MALTADNLLRLYPRAWRKRYGQEFLDTVGREALHLQQVIDIVAGAIDAWLSSDVRRSVHAGKNPSTKGNGGTVMNSAVRAACGQTKMRYTKRDSLIGAAVMVASSLLFAVLGVMARRNGWPAAGEAITSLAFPISMMLSMPFWLLKGQPWRAQAVLIGGTLAMLGLIGYLSTII